MKERCGDLIIHLITWRNKRRKGKKEKGQDENYVNWVIEIGQMSALRVADFLVSTLFATSSRGCRPL